MILISQALLLREGRRLVFTNGVFDILHAGHVRYLQQARELGDLLLVGMNSDASVRGLGKGANRPINPLEDRAEVLSALRSVDGVIAFEEQTPEALVAILQPEIYVKGGDYDISRLPEAKIVARYGGEVKLLPFLEGRSTTAILEKQKSSSD
ncbi:MAG: D-glycero-beta-D-manno-heptose 1-phosphate adenylyltransferase [Fimbriimonadaceae bacterium]